MYNKIVNSSQIIDDLLNLSIILIEMSDRLDDKQYLENLYRFWLNLERSGVDWELLNKSYREILANLTITQNRFEIILKIYSTNFNNLLNHNKVDLILEFHKYFIRLFKKFGDSKELELLQKLLGIYKFFINSNNETLQSCQKSLNILHENYNSNNLQIVCDVLISNIVVVTQLCLKSPQNYRKLIENQQYYKFLNDLSSIIAQFPYKCTDCNITNKIYDAFTVSITILQLGVLFLNKLDFTQELLAYLKEILNSIVVLKNHNCIKWQKAWLDCGKLLYNIGKILVEKNSDNSLKFMKKFIQHTIELEGYNSCMFTCNYCTCSLIEIAKIYHHQKKDYEKSLTITAFNIVITPQHRDALLTNWVKYKANCRSLNVLNSDKIQELTLVKILEKYKHVIHNYDSKFQLSHDQKVELLRLELKTYRDLWKSKIPMMAAFKELYQIDNIDDLVDLFIKIWGDCDIDIHEDLAKLIPKIIKKYESIDYDRLNLAQLYYLHQKYYLKDAVLKITYDMNKTVIFKSETTNDPNEECDIVPSYENLRLKRYYKIMKQLDKALDIINLIEINDSINYDRVYCLLRKIGYEYRLHSNRIQSIYTWYSALKIANYKRNDLQILESTGFLIELINPKQPEIIEELVNKADCIVDNLDRNQNFTEIITYYLSKSLCYYSINIQEAYRIYCDKICGFSDRFDGNFLMKTRILLLHHKFLMSPCKFEIIEHSNLTNLHRIYKDAIQYYNTTSRSGDISYEMSVFFEVTEQIALLYHNLQMPRELRCYCKEIVVLTQRLLLPYRTILLLYYLAYADLTSTRFDDCKVKITGLSDILCLQTKLTPTKSKLEQEISIEIDRLTIEFNEIMLDVPAQITRQFNSPNSPNLQLESFKLPSFFYHQQNCDCFQCGSIEIFEFLLKKTHLDLMWNIYENNQIIVDYFCGALKIFEFIRNKQEVFTGRFTNKLPRHLLPNLIDLNLKTYGCILVEYGNLCLRFNEIDKARRINQYLRVQLSNFQFVDDHLMLDILTQQFNISSLSSVNDNSVKVDFLTVANSDDGSKTPESRQNPVKLSSIKFTPAISPLPLPKKAIRTIQFDLDSDDDVDNNDNRNETLKKGIYNELFREETPAPSKNNSKYNTRSAVKKQNCTKTDKANQSSIVTNDSNLISMSPEAYTPNLKGKTKANLDNRTKLLTERLRSNEKENINAVETKTVRKTTRKLRYN